MTEFALFCVPTLIYLVVQSRGRDRSLDTARRRVGIDWGSPAAYEWALVLMLPLVVAGWLIVVLVPAEVLALPGVTNMQVTTLGAVIGIVLRALGEEVFFRGLLGGILIRRLGFGWGNLLQALMFLLPHLALLLVDVRMWPIIPIQFAAGWLLGWLRHRTGTFVPGAAVHVLQNIAAGLITA
ncbi:CPBP family intramembrane glutamic endopeptidase [Brevibacterium sp. LE-L]|jgi:membrane protease YdiL (CAAX protease family)|uniref:CPBP family intramembrane glutamic endopeptidase n=1 Tax=Brevibacterium sp. LE-L TaxID=3418557 RepID=UPI003CE676CD